jgi:hypothetical protein
LVGESRNETDRYRMSAAEVRRVVTALHEMPTGSGPERDIEAICIRLAE